MTVTSTSTSVTWAGNGSTTEFSYSFLIPAPGQYALYSTTSGVTTQVAQNLYSVSGIGNQGGSVVYPLTGSPVASGTTLTFQRDVPYQQTFHPPAQGPIYNPQLEGALDNLQMQIIQVEQQLGDVSINGTVVNNISFAGSVSVGFSGTDIPGVGTTDALITLPPGPTGAQGVRGSVINIGTGTPGTISGALENDLYLDTAADNIYQFSGTTWALEGSFKGATGARGSTWYDGTRAPGTISGALVNDQYLDTNTGNVYQLGTVGSWVQVANIMGPQGLTGAMGPQGPIGLTGSGSNVLVANNGTLFNTPAAQINFTGATITESGDIVTVPIGMGGINYNGTQYSTLVAGSGVTLIGSASTLTVGADGGMAITDGTNTISSVAKLTVGGLNLEYTETTPTLVRQINSNSASTAQFGTAPATGNYVVFMTIQNGTPPAAPSGFSILAQYFSTLGIAVYGGYATGSNPTFITLGGGYHWCLQEYSGVFGSPNAYAGLGSLVSGTESFVFPGCPAGALIAWGSVDSTSTPASLVPSGTSLLVSCTPNYFLNVLNSPIPTAAPATVGYSNASGLLVMGGVILGGAPAGNSANISAEGAYSQSLSSSPTPPASTSAYSMQGLAGAVTPLRTGNVLIVISGTIVAPTGTAVDDGIAYYISYGEGAAPTNGSPLTGTRVGGMQTYTSASAPAAASDVNVPFSLSAVVPGLTIGIPYWIDVAAESITTASAMGLINVSISAVEV